MHSPVGHPDIDVIDTPDGVCYRLRYSKSYRPSVAVPLISGLVSAVPLALGLMAAVFLIRHSHELSWPLIALPCLFVAHMVFLGRVPLRQLAGAVWLRLVVSLGCGELRLRGRWLEVTRRVGPLCRVGLRWPVASVRRVVAYVYRSEEAAGTAEEKPAPDLGCVAVEQEGAPPFPLVGGYPLDAAVALAEDLHRRLGVTLWEQAPSRRLPPVDVMKTSAEALRPRARCGLPSRRRVVYWLGWHLGGVIGLVALWAGARGTAARDTTTVLTVYGGSLLEFFTIAFTVSLARQRKGSGKTDPEPSATAPAP
jgi:hypothetical protein